jgi:Secretion system C-terminal sorting domain
MKKITLFFAALMSFSAAFGQVIYSETFDAGVMPANITLFNEDGLTPAPTTANGPGVSYVDAAWKVVGRRFTGELDSFAVSTSWYSPAGVASDWLITPAIAVTPNAFFKWSARAFDANYRDGYRVVVATAPTLAAMANGTEVFASDATGEPITWTAHQVILTAFAGQTVYIGIQNNSDDKFLLGVDDLKVEVITAPDAQASAAKIISTEYSAIPSYELGTNKIKLGATVRNNGGAAIVVPVKVNLYNGNTVVYTNTVSSASIAAGATADVVFPDFTPTTTPGGYQAEYITGLVGDGNALNDTIYSGVFAVTNDLFARDEASVGGSITGQFGIDGNVSSTAGGKTMGQVFTLVAPARMDSVAFFVVPSNPAAVGANMNVGLYATNAAGTPTTLIYTTPNYVVAVADTVNGKYIKLPVGQQLAAGTYYLGVNEPAGVFMGIGATNNIYTAGKQFFKTAANTTWRWPASATFAKPLVLEAILSNCAASVTATAAPIACFGGTTTATAVAGGGATTYAWSNGQTTATATGLMAGTYTVTVSSSATCSATRTVVVAAAPAALTATTDGDSQTLVPANGSATVFPVGGTAPYTYVWSNNVTTASNTGLVAGTYTATVTDARGCTTTISRVVANLVSVENVKGLTALSVSPNPTTGVFQMNIRLEKAQTLQVDLTNAQGQLVKTFVQNNVLNETITFNDLADKAPGVYFAKLTIGGESATVVRIAVVK